MWPLYTWALIFFPCPVSQTYCKRRVKPAKTDTEDFQVCDVKCLNHKTISVTGALQMFVLSPELPSPLALVSIINRDIFFFNYLFCKHFTVLSCKNKNKRKSGTRGQGQLWRVVFNLFFVHAFVSLKGLWYSNWQIMASLCFKLIVPGKWTVTWYIKSNLSYCFSAYEAWNSEVFRLKYWSNSLFLRYGFQV